MYPAARRRPPRLARLLDRAWARYDDLSDPQRVLLGVLLALVLAASALYLLGAASLLALQRWPEGLPPSTTSPQQAAASPTEEVEPISPLLADITPTLRPTLTPRPTSTASPTPPRASGLPGAGPPSVSPGGRPLGLTTPTPTGRGIAITPTPPRSLR